MSLTLFSLSFTKMDYPKKRCALSSNDWSGIPSCQSGIFSFVLLRRYLLCKKLPYLKSAVKKPRQEVSIFQQSCNLLAC